MADPTTKTNLHLMAERALREPSEPAGEIIGEPFDMDAYADSLTPISSGAADTVNTADPLRSGPTRIQRRRAKGWHMPERTVYVGRPTIWGNPFVHDDPVAATDAYRRLIQGGTQSFTMGPGALRFAPNAHRKTLHWAYADFVRAHIHKLRGRDLACWCRPGAPCHADVLLDIANTDRVAF
jgi:hypothetical protein